MLTIRKAQLEALREVALQVLIDQLAADARRRLARHTADKTTGQLNALIRAGIARAESLGITHREDLALFVSLVVAHGLEFDASPKLSWTRAILTSKLDAGTRLTVLFDRLPAEMQPDYVPAKTG